MISITMTNTTAPLKFYKVPLYYTGLLTLLSISLVVDSIYYKNIPTDLQLPSVISALVFGVLTYFMWDTTCKYCKRPFSKKEIIEWREHLGVKKEPYTYHTTVYEYSDGTRENAPNSEKTIMRDKNYDRHYYVCKKCEYGFDKEWNEEKGKWLGEAPKTKIIKKKRSSYEFGFDDNSKSNGKRRTPIKQSVKREIFERAGNSCQHCGHTFGLEIHHIDENPSNNSKENLVILCANCHKMFGAISKIALKNEAKKSETAPSPSQIPALLAVKIIRQISSRYSILFNASSILLPAVTTPWFRRTRTFEFLAAEPTASASSTLPAGYAVTRQTGSNNTPSGISDVSIESSPEQA